MPCQRRTGGRRIPPLELVRFIVAKRVFCFELSACFTKAPAHRAGPALTRRRPEAALFRARVR